MKIYHYARIEDWEGIKNGSHKSGRIPGLAANRRVGRENKEAWSTGAVFGLLDPLPKEWSENKDFHLTWDTLRHDIGGRVLLEIQVDDDSNVFVIDRALLEGYLYADKTNIPAKYLFSDRNEAEGAYIKSKIPLHEYLQNKDAYNYSLPEVILTENVPFEKIKISEQQPLIEHDLREYKNAPAIMHSLMRDINSIPELTEWYKKHQSSFNEISNETKLRFK